MTALGQAMPVTMERPDALRSKFLLRPALAVLAVPAAAVLISASASAAPATPAAATARAASTPTARVHPHPLELRHGVKPAGITNSALSTTSPAVSSNWSGYVATGDTSTAGFRYVQATFTVPSVNCTTTPDAAMGAWVGLDGVNYNFSGDAASVEQDGIVAECDSGAPSYYAWWENYPQDATEAFTISPGDAIEASVYWNANAPASQRYNYQLTDVTTGASLNTLQPCGGSCHISSAEVITEAPADATTGDILPLSDYAIVNYENIAVTDRSGQRAGFTSSGWKNTEVIQENSANQIVSTPSSLYGGLAFSTDWERAS
jgi:hypothetical protein